MELEVEAEESATVQLTQRHHYQNLSRPNSLLGPDKEPIKFQINLVGAPPEVEQLIEHIKDVASQFLYHWKTFPISKPLETRKTFFISLIALCLQTCPNPFRRQTHRRPSAHWRPARWTPRMSALTESRRIICAIYSSCLRSTSSTQWRQMEAANRVASPTHSSGRCGSAGKLSQKLHDCTNTRNHTVLDSSV